MTLISSKITKRRGFGIRTCAPEGINRGFHISLLTSDIQTVPPLDFSLTVLHCEAPLVRHPDRVQRHPFVRHTEASLILFRHHCRHVVQQNGRRLRLIDQNWAGPVKEHRDKHCYISGNNETVMHTGHLPKNHL